MLHMVLCCAAAMSTSLLVEKMKKEAESQNIPIDIWAVGVHDVALQSHNADIVLLAPQVKYIKKQLQKKLPHTPIMEISMRDYGTMNGKNVFRDAFNIIKEKEDTKKS